VIEIIGSHGKVKTEETSYHFQGFPSFILARKLKALKADWKVWDEVFSNASFG
jgi:hypothetical protein